jgi:hypothetical protein
MTDREIMQQALDALETADESAFWLKQESIVKVLRERLAQPAPPECQTEEEKAAFAFGWWKAMEAQRLAQPEQEPVAWLYEAGNDRTLHWYKPPLYGTPLYTSPPQRKPLTDEEIDALPLPPSGTATVRDLVRIIEAAHGIGENPDAA